MARIGWLPGARAAPGDAAGLDQVHDPVQARDVHAAARIYPPCG
jgi:hypothetical protein